MVCEAIPTGSVWRTTTAVGAAKSAAIRQAASRSSRSLNDGLAALQPLRVGQRAVAVGRLAVEGGPLVRVLAVGQVRHLLQDDG